jgi:hypothetical protein
MIVALVFSLLLIACGALAASSLILAKRPDAEQVLAKIRPFQGILGIILCLWSLLILIMNLSLMLNIMSLAPVRVLLWLAAVVVAILLGFLLGFALFEGKKGAESGAALSAKLNKIRGPLGLAGIAFGLLFLIMMFV